MLSAAAVKNTVVQHNDLVINGHRPGDLTNLEASGRNLSSE